MLHRMLLGRRSVRSFETEPLGPEDLDAIEQAILSAPSVHGRRSGRALLVTGTDRVNAVTDALLTGIVGKMNLWLGKRDRPPALVVLTADPDRSPVRDGRYLYNVDVALAGEAAVAAAAVRGIGSVWMAAIGEREVVRAMDLAQGQRVVAVIALGRPRGSGLYDGLTQLVISGKRRPLASIASAELFGSPLGVQPPDPVQRADMLAMAGGPFVDREARLVVPPLCTRFDGLPGDDEMRVALDAARWAPNAENAQIWRWVVVRDARRRHDLLLAAGVPEATEAGDCALVAGCAAPFAVKHRTRQQPFSLIDVPIAALHQALVAHRMGHGWNLLVDLDARGMGLALGLPADHEAVCVLMLGRPVEGPAASWSQMEVDT